MLPFGGRARTCRWKRWKFTCLDWGAVLWLSRAERFFSRGKPRSSAVVLFFEISTKVLSIWTGQTIRLRIELAVRRKTKCFAATLYACLLFQRPMTHDRWPCCCWGCFWFLRQPGLAFFNFFQNAQQTFTGHNWVPLPVFGNCSHAYEGRPFMVPSWHWWSRLRSDADAEESFWLCSRVLPLVSWQSWGHCSIPWFGVTAPIWVSWVQTIRSCPSISFEALLGKAWFILPSLRFKCE